VVVSREIRRDGQNRYFLNKSEILLRDLIDFFAKARLGSRGLVIIGQGDSDLFVRSSPMERREMIEEILGLREYQLKKSDAERRLKNSRINLDKTKALIEEILPHLRSLKRQTNRWERRGELEVELRELESKFFGSQLHELNIKAEELARKIAVEEARRQTLEDHLRDAEAGQAKIEAGRPEEQKGLVKIKEDIRALIDQKNDLQKDVGRLEAQMEMAKKSGAKLGGGRSFDKLLDFMKKIKEELETAIRDGDAFEVQAAVENVVEEIQWTLEEEHTDGKAEVPDNLKTEFEKISRDLRTIDGELAKLREQEGSFEKNQDAFYATFKAAVEGVQNAKNALDAWERGSREQLLDRERLGLRREEIVRQIEQAGRQHGEFEDSELLLGRVEQEDIERRMFRLRGDLASMGDVDQALVKEAHDTEARYAFLTKESADLEKAVADLTGLMAELTQKITTEFERSLKKINEEFEKFFGLMFGGGIAKLKVESPKLKAKTETESGSPVAEESDEQEDDRSDLGVDIEIRLPRKKISSLDMLSGGERSLVGIAALFALVSVSPPPFLVLDEIDAPLDERNARRFAEMLKDFSKHTQFIVVTHNRATMESADILYGVTLNEDGTSKILSLKLDPIA
jgi:chromosome segregation protein